MPAGGTAWPTGREGGSDGVATDGACSSTGRADDGAGADETGTAADGLRGRGVRRPVDVGCGLRGWEEVMVTHSGAGLKPIRRIEG